MGDHPLRGQWYYVKLPFKDDPDQSLKWLKVLTVGRVTVCFGKPKLGNPEEIEFLGTYLINKVTWMS